MHIKKAQQCISKWFSRYRFWWFFDFIMLYVTRVSLLSLWVTLLSSVDFVRFFYKLFCFLASRNSAHAHKNVYYLIFIQNMSFRKGQTTCFQLLKPEYILCLFISSYWLFVYVLLRLLCIFRLYWLSVVYFFLTFNKWSSMI